jgi:hypothetical protein
LLDGERSEGALQAVLDGEVGASKDSETGESLPNGGGRDPRKCCCPSDADLVDQRA